LREYPLAERILGGWQALSRAVDVPARLQSIPFPFAFLRTLLHFFALPKTSTHLFSGDSTFCVKKRNDRGNCPRIHFGPGTWALPLGSPCPLPFTSCATLIVKTPMNRGSGLRIGKILGIPIYLHSTWVVIFAGITYLIASQYRQQHPAWSETQHWAVGVVTSLLFFASVLFHELAHSIVAQHYKIRVVSITLFLFGGLARIEREPSNAIQEFNIAIAGPLASGFLSLAFLGLMLIFSSIETVAAVASLLCGINGVLAVFNLLPGFPLDGGRILRAIVWGATKNFDKATRVAGGGGKIIAYSMILWGAWGVLHGDIQKLWTVLIGWFILNAAQESVAQLAVRETLAGLSAADVMSKEVPTIAGHITLEEYSTEVLRTGRRVHLVVNDDRFVGMMNVHTLNSITRDEWAHNSVQAVMIPREKILWTSPEEPLLRLLERLLSADVNQMPVVTGVSDGAPQIVGIVTRDSILRVMQTRSELGPLATSR
jgi:Zn-dependent protease